MGILFISVWDNAKIWENSLKWIVTKFVMNQFQCLKFALNEKYQKVLESTPKESNPSNMWINS